MNDDGISYTEMEFDYAFDKGIPVLAFVHNDPKMIISGKTDQNDEARSKLDVFRQKVCSGRHVKFWENSESLNSAVLQALVTEVKRNPREGWVRASKASDPETLEKLRLEVESLRKSGPPVDSDLLVGGKDLLKLTVKNSVWGRTNDEEYEVSLSWDDLFAAVGPALMQEATEHTFRSRVATAALSFAGKSGLAITDGGIASVSVDQFDMVKIQLLALNLIEKGKIKRPPSDKSIYWALTQHGDSYLMKLSALRRK